MTNSEIIVKSCDFNGGYSMNGGAIYISGESSLYIEGSTFTENNA